MKLLNEFLEEYFVNVCWNGGFGILSKGEVDRRGRGKTLVEYPGGYVLKKCVRRLWLRLGKSLHLIFN